jgi:hypothetical protein
MAGVVKPLRAKVKIADRAKNFLDFIREIIPEGI